MLAVVLGVLAIAAAAAVGRLSDLWHLPFPGFGGFVLTVLLAFQVAFLLHEAGHLIGARLVDFRPRQLAAMLVQVAWVNGKARLRAPSGSLRWSGLVLVSPTGTHDLERRMAVFIAGGPAASLVVGALLGTLAFWLAPAGVAYLLLHCAGFTLAVGLLTLAPYRSGGLLSDGARLLRMWEGGAVVRRDVAIWAIGALIHGADRPRDVPEELADHMLAPQDDSPEQAQAEALAAIIAFDRGDEATGMQHWQRAMALIERVPEPIRPNFYLDAAYIAARYESDPVRGAAYLEKSAGGIGLERWHRARAGAAVALAAGEPERALALAREGLQALAGRQATGLIEMERSLLEDLAAGACAALASL